MNDWAETNKNTNRINITFGSVGNNPDGFGQKKQHNQKVVQKYGTSQSFPSIEKMAFFHLLVPPWLLLIPQRGPDIRITTVTQISFSVDRCVPFLFMAGP